MGLKVDNTALASDALQKELRNLRINKLIREYKEEHPNLSDEEYEIAKKKIAEKVYKEED
ncbi:hypothetical protein OKW22_001295 [Bacilli bacterium PM5-3]|nr:hypothetical protein [Bacilli bacterium PM5-3]MDH6603350.1 hypothetical protein [Bacilli bacterium PM5-9]